MLRLNYPPDTDKSGLAAVWRKNEGLFERRREQSWRRLERTQVWTREILEYGNTNSLLLLMLFYLIAIHSSIIVI